MPRQGSGVRSSCLRRPHRDDCDGSRTNGWSKRRATDCQLAARRRMPRAAPTFTCLAFGRLRAKRGGANELTGGRRRSGRRPCGRWRRAASAWCSHWCSSTADDLRPCGECGGVPKRPGRNWNWNMNEVALRVSSESPVAPDQSGVGLCDGLHDVFFLRRSVFSSEPGVRGSEGLMLRPAVLFSC